MLDEIKTLIKEAEQFSGKNIEEIEKFRIKFLGKKGEITKLFSEFRNVPVEQKKDFGQTINKLKEEQRVIKK